MEGIGKAMFSETEDVLSDYGDVWTRYYDKWDEIINPKQKVDSDKDITQLQVEVEKRNQADISGDS